MKKWALLITSVVVILALIGFFGALSDDDSPLGGLGKSSSGDGNTEPPLPSATRVSPSGGVTLPPVPGRPARIRFEIYGATTKADITYGSDADDSPRLDDHAVPWAAEVSVPDTANDIVLDAFSNEKSSPQLSCRIYVNGVLVASAQSSGYAHCRTTLEGIYGQ